MWAELVTPHWAGHRLLLMVMKSVDLQSRLRARPPHFSPGGVLRFLKRPGSEGVDFVVVLRFLHTHIHTRCWISEPALVNRSHVDSHVDHLLWVFILYRLCNLNCTIISNMLLSLCNAQGRFILTPCVLSVCCVTLRETAAYQMSTSVSLCP